MGSGLTTDFSTFPVQLVVVGHRASCGRSALPSVVGDRVTDSAWYLCDVRSTVTSVPPFDERDRLLVSGGVGVRFRSEEVSATRPCVAERRAPRRRFRSSTTGGSPVASWMVARARRSFVDSPDAILSCGRLEC